MRALLWDLDGTLVDSAADIAAAADATLREHGLPVLGEARVRGFIGDGARKLVDRCVVEAGGVPEPRMLDTFLSYYASNVVVHTRIWPVGIDALVRRVASPQAVVTNKPEQLARDVLASFDLQRELAVVIGGDTLPERKPDPAPVHEALRRLGVRDAILVGDGPADVGAARNAGIPCIGVGWGIAAPTGATELVDTLEALEARLRAWGIAIRDDVLCPS
jgi:phosphoglycolate phosphatase